MNASDILISESFRKSLEAVLLEAADEIEQLRKERDDARREVCEWVAMMTKRKPSTAAKDRNWDCFKEKP